MTDIQLGETYSIMELFGKSYLPQRPISFRGMNAILYTRFNERGVLVVDRGRRNHRIVAEFDLDSGEVTESVSAGRKYYKRKARPSLIFRQDSE